MKLIHPPFCFRDEVEFKIMSTEIINRVAQSSIITINLEDYFPSEEIIILDMKDWLFHGLILKEADFREKLEVYDWSQFQDKIVCLVCSADAIVPLWAYMLFVTKLQPIAANTFFGDMDAFLAQHYHDVIYRINADEYMDKRIVIKGCGDKAVPSSAYIDITQHLLPVTKSIMFGEPCSTVPVYKKKTTSPTASR